jgi:hypothetical protein
MGAGLDCRTAADRHARVLSPTSLDTVYGFVALQVIAALTILVLAEQGWSTRRTRRRWPPVTILWVPMILIFGQRLAPVALVDDEIRSRSSRRMLPTNRSAMAFARGARTAVLIIGIPASVKTESIRP